jgi:ribosomal protein L9
MNNIRKIIERRLDNARNDIKECLSENKVRELVGTAQAYQDCLNLMQPRTETDIINELKELGWNLQKQRLSYEYHFYKYGGYHIEIKGGDKVIAYEEGHEDWSCGEYEMHKPIFIPYDVYKLIYELLNLEEE